MAPTAASASTLTTGALARPLADLASARHWYVAFSGGMDSTVLLHLLLAWQQDNPGLPPVSAIHVDHGLQESSGEWSEHCERICSEWQVPIQVRRVDAAAFGSGEAAARSARYGVFKEIVREGEVLLLAHHLDDQVETFFLRLMRGAGVDGLAAMPRRRALGHTDSASGELVRPLLDVPRNAIESYAREHGLGYIDDPSNADATFDRNYLRNDVLPLLAERWPGYRGAVNRAATHMAAASGLLHESVALPAGLLSTMGDAGLPLAAVTAGSEEAASLVLRRWLGSHGCAAPDRAPLVEFLRQLRSAPADARPRLALANCTLERYRDGVYLLPSMTAPEPVELAPGAVFSLDGIGRLTLVAVARDGFALAPGQVPRVCWREGGERLRLPGREHSVSLKQFLQERGVPPWWRDRIPLLMLDDELLCVGDLTPCHCPQWREKPGPGEILWRLLWDRDLLS